MKCIEIHARIVCLDKLDLSNNYVNRLEISRVISFIEFSLRVCYCGRINVVALLWAF
jgi:hypothetical protein